METNFIIHWARVLRKTLGLKVQLVFLEKLSHLIGEEIPCLLQNWKFHCHTHKNPPLKPVESNRYVKILIYKPILTLSPFQRLGLPYNLLLQVFGLKTYMHFSSFACMLHVPPTSPPWFDLSNTNWWREQWWSFSLWGFLHIPVNDFPNILLATLYPNIFRAWPSVRMSDQVTWKHQALLYSGGTR
jgi:hypothetical protein